MEHASSFRTHAGSHWFYRNESSLQTCVLPPTETPSSTEFDGVQECATLPRAQRITGDLFFRDVSEPVNNSRAALEDERTPEVKACLTRGEHEQFRRK